MNMQTIYAYSYNPAIATGTNTTSTVWRMAYQQPIMLYKGTANTIKIVVFNNNQKVVDLTNYDVQVQIVDRETEEHFVTRTATNTDPETGVVNVTFTEADLRFLQHRFYHIIARLMPPNDGSTVVNGEILYLDDNYGAFTPVTIEDAWNYSPGNTAVADGVSNLDLTAVANVIPSITNTYYLGNTTNRWHSLFTGNATLGNLVIAGSNIQTSNSVINLTVDTQTFGITDNSTDPTHQAGDGGFLEFNDSTHTNDGPRLEIWYGNVSEPADPPGQHSLDIRAAANSYVEFASNDLTMFMGIDDTSPFVQTNFDIYPDRYWRFLPDGELRLPFDGSKITSHGGQIQMLLNFEDLRFLITDLDGSTIHETIFDTTGDVYFDGDLLPGSFTPDPTPQHSLGSLTHPWNNLFVEGSIVADGILIGGEPYYAYLSLPNNANANIYSAKLGNDNGNVSLSAMDQGGSAFEWIFDINGDLTFPDGTIQSTAWSGGRVRSVPGSSIGASGDQTGDLAFNGSYIYYCTANYDGSSNIWKRVAWSNDTW